MSDKIKVRVVLRIPTTVVVTAAPLIDEDGIAYDYTIEGIRVAENLGYSQGELEEYLCEDEDALAEVMDTVTGAKNDT